MRYKHILLVILAGVLILAACAPAGRAALSELTEHQSTWAEQAIRDYRFTLEVRCFCPPDHTRAVIVDVRDGVTESITYADTGEPVSDAAWWASYASIDKLFAYVQSSIDQGADSVNIEYDATYAFPTSVGIDFIEEALDDENGLLVYDFEIVDPSAAGPYEPILEALAQAQQLWQSHALSDYRFTLQAVCFCVTDYTRPVVIEVRGGVVESITYVDTGEIASDPSLWERHDTVDKLFSYIQSAVDNEAASINIDYDATYGFPTRVDIDFIGNAIDDEALIMVSNLEALEAQDVAAEHEQAQQLWQSQGNVDYRFTLQIGCFCAPDVRRPVIIEVRGGELQSITFADTGESVSDATFWERYDTIDKVFAYIQSAIDEEAARIDVQYDATYGFPTELYIDFSEAMADEENGLTLSNFEPVEVDVAAEHAQAQQVWEVQASADYRFTLQVGCFCAPDVRRPVIIEVRGGVLESMTFADTGESVSDATFWERYDTIDKVFAYIQSAIDEDAARIDVQYDATYGFPTELYIDFSEAIADEENGLTLSNFELVEATATP